MFKWCENGARSQEEHGYFQTSSDHLAKQKVCKKRNHAKPGKFAKRNHAKQYNGSETCEILTFSYVIRNCRNETETFCEAKPG